MWRRAECVGGRGFEIPCRIKGKGTQSILSLFILHKHFSSIPNDSLIPHSSV